MKREGEGGAKRIRNSKLSSAEVPNKGKKIAVFLSNIYSRKFILAELKCEVSFKIECCSAGVQGFV